MADARTQRFTDKRGMSREAKEGYGSALAFVALGLLALCLGTRWLLVLIPMAIVVWLGIEPMLRRRRN